MAQSFLEAKKISEEILTEHLYGLFSTFLDSIAKRDYEGLEKITEKNFHSKIVS
jgi:hypothetical protein